MAASGVKANAATWGGKEDMQMQARQQPDPPYQHNTCGRG